MKKILWEKSVGDWLLRESIEDTLLMPDWGMDRELIDEDLCWVYMSRCGSVEYSVEYSDDDFIEGLMWSITQDVYVETYNNDGYCELLSRIKGLYQKYTNTTPCWTLENIPDYSDDRISLFLYGGRIHIAIDDASVYSEEASKFEIDPDEKYPDIKEVWLKWVQTLPIKDK
jgi:hypothetical protein